MRNYFLLNLFLVFALLLPVRTVVAQDELPDHPIYIVQEGETLWQISQRFGVAVADLAEFNNLTDPNQVPVGMRLGIPGFEGIRGILTTQTVPFGENLRSLSRRYQVPIDVLIRLNHLISPVELFVGSYLILPEDQDAIPNPKRLLLQPGQSLLELAALMQANPWTIANTNQLSGTWQVIPGDILLLPGNADDTGPAGLPSGISQVEISPYPLAQGKTTTIKLTNQSNIQVTGFFNDRQLNFFPENDGFVALQGVHAMLQPGIYPMSIDVTFQNGSTFDYTQLVAVTGVDYPYDRPLNVPPETVDPEVTKPEDSLWSSLGVKATPKRYWSGILGFPSALPVDYCLKTNECWPSRFGNRRSYNGSTYKFFHTGLDIVGKIGAEIYAPAAGVVVFAGPLAVRGNATVIDHGWGVYTAYLHQSELKVSVGDLVEIGQVIGMVGNTGRAEGPHLHWEVWVGGVQVDPLDWLQEEYP